MRIPSPRRRGTYKRITTFFLGAWKRNILVSTTTTTMIHNHAVESRCSKSLLSSLHCCRLTISYQTTKPNVHTNRYCSCHHYAHTQRLSSIALTALSLGCALLASSPTSTPDRRHHHRQRQRALRPHRPHHGTHKGRHRREPCDHAGSQQALVERRRRRLPAGAARGPVLAVRRV